MLLSLQDAKDGLYTAVTQQSELKRTLRESSSRSSKK